MRHTIRLGLLAMMLALGCNKGGGSAPGDAAQLAAGRAAFDNNGCARCHSINGQGGRMGPDLTRVGGQPGHTPVWLAEHVKNPKTHNPGSRMPAFEGKISDTDLRALSAYLASLR